MNDKANFMTRQIDAQTTALGRRISDTASTVRTLGDRMQDETGSAEVAKLAQTGATWIDGVGRYLQDADTDRLIADFEDLAEQRPMTVAAGAFIVGLAISRFLKSSRRTGRSGTDASSAYNASTTYGSYGSSTGSPSASSMPSEPFARV